MFVTERLRRAIISLAWLGGIVCLFLLTIAPSLSRAQDAIPFQVDTLAYSPDGIQIAVAGSVCHNKANPKGNFGIRILDANGTVVKAIGEYSCHVNAVAWSPDGTQIASSNEDGSAFVWDAETGEKVATYSASGSGASSLRNVAWNPVDERIVVQGGGRSTNVWNGSTGKLIAPVFDEATFAITSVDWSPDGLKMAIGTLADKVEIFDVHPDGEPYPLVLRFDAKSVFDLDWSPDASQIATSAGFEVQIFDATSGELVQTLSGAEDNLLTAAWSPEGERIAAGGMDGKVRIWNVATGEEMLSFDHTSPVLVLDWSPNGEQVAYGGYPEPDSSNIVDIADTPYAATAEAPTPA